MQVVGRRHNATSRRCMHIYCEKNEVEHGQYLCFEAHFVQFAALLEPWSARIDQKETNAVRNTLRRSVGDCNNNNHVRHVTIGNEHLTAIQNPVGTVSLRCRFDALQVTVTEWNTVRIQYRAWLTSAA